MISNSIDGIMLKTNDLYRPETVKVLLHNITFRDVSYKTNGPMTSLFTIKNMHCSEVSYALGGYLQAQPFSGIGNAFNLNISTFLKDNGANCDFYF